MHGSKAIQNERLLAPQGGANALTQNAEKAIGILEQARINKFDDQLAEHSDFADAQNLDNKPKAVE
jgi:hypothetical protein